MTTTERKYGAEFEVVFANEDDAERVMQRNYCNFEECDCGECCGHAFDERDEDTPIGCNGCECSDCRDNDAVAGAEHWTSRGDGSLPDDTGVEFVHVAEGVAFEQLHRDTNVLYTMLDGKLQANRSAGTHIHVDRSTVSELAIAKLSGALAYQRYSHGYDLSRFYDALARRTANGYCERNFKPVAVVENVQEHVRERTADGRPKLVAIDYKKQLTTRRNGHYAAISYSDHWPTYEMRLFAGCSRKDQALATVETADAMLEIAEHGGYAVAWVDGFLRELARRKDQYPNLVARFDNHRAALHEFQPLFQSAVEHVEKLNALHARRAKAFRLQRPEPALDARPEVV
jgi:hypothetical protein